MVHAWAACVIDFLTFFRICMDSPKAAHLASIALLQNYSSGGLYYKL